MKLVERATPVAAVVAAISTLACCLPLSFLGAIGLAGAGVWLFPVRRWFVAGALVFLVIGFVQLYRRRGQCTRRSPVSIALFWVATGIVLIIVLFPQVVASLIAG